MNLNYKYYVAIDNVNSALKIFTTDHLGLCRNKCVALADYVLDMTQLKEIHRFLVEMNMNNEGLVEKKIGEYEVSIKTTSYLSRYNDIIREEFAKEGIVATKEKAEVKYISSSYKGFKRVLLKVDQLCTPLAEKVAVANEAALTDNPLLIQNKLDLLKDDLEAVSKRIALRTISLIADVIVRGERITSVSAVVRKDGIEVFNASHFLTLKDAGMNIIVGESKSVMRYKNKVEKVVGVYKTSLSNENLTFVQKFAGIHEGVKKVLSDEIARRTLELVEEKDL